MIIFLYFFFLNLCILKYKTTKHCFENKGKTEFLLFLYILAVKIGIVFAAGGDDILRGKPDDLQFYFFVFQTHRFHPPYSVAR